MKQLVVLLWCSGLALALGCSAVDHSAPRAPAPVSPGRSDNSSHFAPLVPARVSSEYDPIYAAVVHWILDADATEHYFIGHEYHKNLVGFGDPYVYEDPSGQLMHALAELGSRVEPLSAYHGSGTKLMLGGCLLEGSYRGRVLAGISGHRSFYIVEFSEGEWRVVREEPTYFK